MSDGYVATRPYVEPPARLAVLLSGRGSNLEALASACDQGRLPARIVLALSDRSDAPGLVRARGRGLPTLAVVRMPGESRPDHEARLAAAIAASGADLICLAGFMRILSPRLLADYPLRILNIHPSLLPAFPGLHAHDQAVRYGVQVSGATVHFVDAGTDTGPIVAQRALPLLPAETAEAYAERLMPLEHALYVDAVGRILSGGWRIEGRRVVLPS